LGKEKNGIVGCDYSYQPETSSWVERLWFKSNYPVLESATWLPAGNMLIRKGLFFKIGGFREDIETAEDWDLCARMIGLGYHVISDGRMKCIHVGNPKTLREFFQKELWYGKGAAQLYYNHGIRGPIQKLTLTCLIAIYVLLLDVLFIILGQGVAWSWLPLTVSIVFLHPVVMGVRRSLAHGRIYLLPGLTLLYAVYFFARCAAWQHYLFQHPLRYLIIWRHR
jgi:cellulose synthase/poly-beta-1,6-N-acetylglucosamine synthase-like glycosyltransferase